MNDTINPALVEKLTDRINKNELVGGASREENKTLYYMRDKGLIRSAKRKCGWEVVEKGKGTVYQAKPEPEDVTPDKK